VIFFFFSSLIIIDLVFENINPYKPLESTELTDIRKYKDLSFYLCICKTVLFAITSFITMKERNLILKEIDQSPYSVVNENLTEALYKNIIEQGKHPEDPNLFEAYLKLSNPSNSNEDSKNLSRNAINKSEFSSKSYRDVSRN
jgi:hypothetical protein